MGEVALEWAHPHFSDAPSGAESHCNRPPAVARCEAEKRASLTIQPVVDPAKDRKNLALLVPIAGQRILLRSALVQDGQRGAHPFAGKLLAAEDLNRAGMEDFRAGMLQLIGLLRQGIIKYTTLPCRILHEQA